MQFNLFIKITKHTFLKKRLVQAFGIQMLREKSGETNIKSQEFRHLEEFSVNFRKYLVTFAKEIKNLRS